MSCLFCELAAGDPRTALVLSDESCAAFLDHRPLFPGHTLVVPKSHVETLDDAPPELLGPLLAAARRVAVALERGLGAEGTFVAMNNRISQSVPHLHVHVVPRRKGDGLKGFFWPRSKYASAEEMEETRRRLVAALPD
jgi:histidine triad (HIT) family protein